VTLADVKGLEAAKQAVMDALVNPVRHPDIYRTLKIKNGKGLLLYGPPGTGKTMFARAVAGELGLPFLYKKMSELKDKYVGESEKNVARLFEEAQSHKRCVVFLDECESILRKRGNQKINVVEQFLAELDGFGTRRDVQLFLILATNRPWLIDSAVTRSGRIGLAVHVGLPDAETRRAIVSAALEGVPLAPDVDVESIVARTEGYSGAELHHGDGGGVCDEAAMEASRRWVKRREPLHPGDPEWNRVEEVTAADFETALEKVVPVSRKDPEIVRKNREFSLSNAAAGEDGEPEAD
jgi:transitional endoplasmic reticulum ATPase